MGAPPPNPHLVGRYRGLRVGGASPPPTHPPENLEEAPPPQTPPENYFRILAGGDDDDDDTTRHDNTETPDPGQPPYRGRNSSIPREDLPSLR